MTSSATCSRVSITGGDGLGKPCISHSSCPQCHRLQTGPGNRGHRGCEPEREVGRWGRAGQEERSGCPLCTGHWHQPGHPVVALGNVKPGPASPLVLLWAQLLAPGLPHAPPGTPCTRSPSSSCGSSGRHREGGSCSCPLRGQCCTCPGAPWDLAAFVTLLLCSDTGLPSVLYSVSSAFAPHESRYRGAFAPAD